MKYKSDRIIERYKIRLVTQKFSQVSKVDFPETFVPTIRRESLKIFFVFTTLLSLLLIQIDVINAYLESILGQNEQPIFMRMPQGKQLGRSGLVYKFFKSLYSLKQVRRLWNKIVIKFFQKIGFNIMNKEPRILILVYRRDLNVVGVCMDDLLLRSKSYTALE